MPIQNSAKEGQLPIGATRIFTESCIMTRSSVLAVIAFAAVGSSCLVSTDAFSAFCHGFDGHYRSSRPTSGQPAKQSFAAIRHFRQTPAAASNTRTSGDGRHTVRAPSAEVTTAVACGAACGTPETDGTPLQRGKGGVGGAATGAGKTNDVAVSVDRSSADKTNDVAVSVDRSGADKTNGLAVSGDGSGITVIGGKWTGVGAGGDADDTTFRAIALGLSEDGAWVVRTAPTLTTAGAGALRACGEQFGQCTLSEAQVGPTHFGCLVVIQSDDASRVFAAAGDSSDLARAAATAQIANAGLRGQIVFTGCNS
jgi:hypothetical protein